MSTFLIQTHSIASELVARALPAAIGNPFDGVTPSIDVFGVQFVGAVGLILGGLWGLVLFGTAGAFLVNVGKWGIAKKRNRADDITEGADGAKAALLAFGAAVGVSVIIGAVIFIVQTAGADPTPPEPAAFVLLSSYDPGMASV